MSPKRFINDLPSPRRRRIVPIGSRLWSCFLASRFFFPFFFFGIFRSFGEFHFILRRMRTMPHCGTCRTRMGLSAAPCKIFLPREGMTWNEWRIWKCPEFVNYCDLWWDLIDLDLEMIVDQNVDEKKLYFIFYFSVSLIYVLLFLKFLTHVILGWRY